MKLKSWTWLTAIFSIFILFQCQLGFAAPTAGGSKQKVVIFWGSIGFGHLSAARAVEAEIKAADPTAEVILKDALEIMPNSLTSFTKKGYDILTKKFPSTYDLLFRGYMYFATQADTMGNMWVGLRIGPDRILNYLNEVKPTLIVSTFSHATEALVNLRNNGALKDIPIAQVLTDYVDETYFERLGDEVDMSFVPHEDIRTSWIAQGLPEDKVATSGIPVAPEAFEPLDDSTRRLFLEERGLDPQVKTVILVSGSAGVGDFPAIIKSVAREVKSNIQLVAVCAKNEKHLDSLTALAPSLPENIKLKILGLVKPQELLNYIKASDIMITKSGGLTSSEVAVIGKPVILLDINGGQERHNSKFFSDRGMGLTTDKENQVGKNLNTLLANPNAGLQMVESQNSLRQMINPKKISAWFRTQSARAWSLTKSAYCRTMTEASGF